MKCKYLFLSFYLLLIASVGYRLLQVVSQINKENGFFSLDAKGNLYTIVILAIISIVLFLSLLVRRCPAKPPRVNPALSISSFVFSALLAVNAVITIIDSSAYIGGWALFIFIVSILAVAFGLVYCVKAFIDFHIKSYLYIIPLIYWLTKLIETYMQIAKNALVSENSLLVLSTVSICFFYLYFAKYASGIISKNTHKEIMFFGFLSVIFSETFAVPKLIDHFIFHSELVNNSIQALLLYAAVGVFILIYLISFFSNKNLFRHHRSSESKNILPINDESSLDSADSNPESAPESEM